MKALTAFKRPPVEMTIMLAACISLLLVGSIAVPAFLSAGYLLQQMQIASFLGVVAIGALAVIMIGHIDLSVPWTMTASAIAATTVAAFDDKLPGAAVLSLPAGLIVGALIGLFNGFGVAVLRVRSMSWTLGVSVVVLGLCVLVSGGFARRGVASDLIRGLSVGSTFGVPHPALLWLTGLALFAFFLKSTVFGQALIAFGHGER